MTATLPATIRTMYRLRRMEAVATLDGIAITEQWHIATLTAEGRTEAPAGEPRVIDRTRHPLPELHGDYADEELPAEFDRVSDWTPRPDGTLAAEVDYHDPTP